MQMQQHDIRARGQRRFKVTTDSRHDLPIAPNVLDRQFTVAEPDKILVGDINYIATDEGWLYLAVVIDLFSRQVPAQRLADSLMWYWKRSGRYRPIRWSIGRSCWSM